MAAQARQRPPHFAARDFAGRGLARLANASGVHVRNPESDTGMFADLEVARTACDAGKLAPDVLSIEDLTRSRSSVGWGRRHALARRATDFGTDPTPLPCPLPASCSPLSTGFSSSTNA
jgi:hypothetical protein